MFGQRWESKIMNESGRELSREAFHKLLVLFRHLRQGARQIKGKGISPRDFSVLRLLLEGGPATVGEIQAYIYRSPSTVSALVAKLERAGLVIRTRSEQDQRVVIVALTSAGRSVVEHTPLVGLPLLRRRLANLPQERLVHINQALTDILYLLEVTTGE
jgi:DNA-binding MarR family transcriptional regulator